MQDRTDYLSGGAENAEANAAETAVQTGGGEINGIFSAKEILKKRKHHHHEKRSPVFTVLWIIVFVLVSVWTVSLLYSLFWMLAGSLKDNYDFYFNKFGFPEFDLIAWDNYALAFNNLYVTTYPTSGIRNVYFEELLFNTLYITLVSAFLSVFVPAIMGYVSAKYHFWFNKVIHFIVVFSIVVPIGNTLSSMLQVMQAVGLYDNMFLGTIILRCGFIGTNFLYMQSAFKGVSDDYMDAAFIDGAGHFRVLFLIMFPMIKNVFMMFFLLQLIAWWNTWDFTLIYMPTHPNFAQAVYNVQFSTEPALQDKPVQLAVGIFVMLPAFALFFVFRKSIMQQVSFGGLKG